MHGQMQPRRAAAQTDAAAGLGHVSPPSLAACPSYLAPDPWMPSRCCQSPLVSETEDKPSNDAIGGGPRGAPAGLSGLGMAEGDGSLSWPLWCCDGEGSAVAMWTDGPCRCWICARLGTCYVGLLFHGSHLSLSRPRREGKRKGASGAEPRSPRGHRCTVRLSRLTVTPTCLLCGGCYFVRLYRKDVDTGLRGGLRSPASSAVFKPAYGWLCLSYHPHTVPAS
ncbi:hypothetical protein QBC39DRAFT_133409 [Podospora conica]|nr:hypothetical protein QBC39DRAFT_133409 [Schizothecium conicum]